MIVSTTHLDDNNGGNKNKKLFTIQYPKEELNKIQNDFLEQLSSYFAKVNNNNSNRNKEVELFPPTNSTQEFVKIFDSLSEYFPEHR